MEFKVFKKKNIEKIDMIPVYIEVVLRPPRLYTFYHSHLFEHVLTSPLTMSQHGNNKRRNNIFHVGTCSYS